MKKIYTAFMAAAMLLLSSSVAAQETDVTAKYLKNPSFENSFTNWTQTNFQTQTNGYFTLTAGKTYIEKWTDRGGKVGNAEVYQTLSKLPAGQYRLQVAAHNIQQDNETAKQTGAWIYAGTEKTTVTVTETYSVEFTTLGESLNVGFKASSASGNWLCADNFKLFFIGADGAKMLTLLQTQIAAAEKTLSTAARTTPPLMQTAVQDSLTAAIDEAKKLDSTATAEEFGTMALALEVAHTAASANYTAMSALKSLSTKAVSYTRDTRKMAAAYKQALVDAYNAALAVLALESDADPEMTKAALQEAYDAAIASNTAYTALNKDLTSANNLSTTDKEGVEELEAAIAAATLVLNDDNASPENMDAARLALDTAVLIFRVANGSGSEVSARTDGVVQGATEIFARATFGSGTTKEKGICFSTESPEPTIFDNRTMDYYSNNGTIYVVHDAKPATLYYVRAYTISNNYRVSYGDVVKIYTRPMGNSNFSYGYEGDDATDARILAACEEGVWMWNNISGIQNFHLDAHYVPGAGAGDGTADCSYGGYMRVSQNTAYQKTGTILHEGAHGLGMVPYTDWTNSTYRSNGDRGDWLGPRVDRVVQFLDNSATAKLHGDTQHMWPYGINGASEDNGSPILYRANALLVGALAEDGIRTPNMDFLRPAYSFTQDDETKYYIKSANESTGLKTAYLTVTTTGLLRWEEMSGEEALANDSCAWNITFDPKTCYYQFRNVGSGRVMNYTGTGNNGIRTALNPTASSRFQLLGARSQTTIDGFTFSTTAYWVVAPSSQASLNAAANNAISSISFNHADAATSQRWLMLTADEVSLFGEAMGETVGVRSLNRTPKASLQVLGGQGVVCITALNGGTDVEVYSLDGRLLHRLYVQQDANATLRLPRGIYLVNDRKVMVR